METEETPMTTAPKRKPGPKPGGKQRRARGKRFPTSPPPTEESLSEEPLKVEPVKTEAVIPVTGIPPEPEANPDFSFAKEAPGVKKVIPPKAFVDMGKDLPPPTEDMVYACKSREYAADLKPASVSVNRFGKPVSNNDGIFLKAVEHLITISKDDPEYHEKVYLMEDSSSYKNRFQRYSDMPKGLSRRAIALENLNKLQPRDLLQLFDEEQKNKTSVGTQSSKFELIAAYLELGLDVTEDLVVRTQTPPPLIN